MVFLVTRVPDLFFAEPLSFRTLYTGRDRELYRYNAEGTRTHVDRSLRKRLKAFASMWFRNLRAQGFLALTRHSVLEMPWRGPCSFRVRETLS